MNADGATFEIPPVMKVEDCEALFLFLEQAEGQPVTLQCGAVSRIPGLAAQTLLFATQKWAKDGISLSLTDQSDGCVESLKLLGLSDLIAQEQVTL